jgi:hypothetical protein
MKLFRVLLAIALVAALGCRHVSNGVPHSGHSEVRWMATNSLADATTIEVEYLATFDSKVNDWLMEALWSKWKPQSIRRISEWLTFSYPTTTKVTLAESRSETISTSVLVPRKGILEPHADDTTETEYVFSRGLAPGSGKVKATYAMLLSLERTGGLGSFVTVVVTADYCSQGWRFHVRVD